MHLVCLSARQQASWAPSVMLVIWMPFVAAPSLSPFFGVHYSLPWEHFKDNKKPVQPFQAGCDCSVRNFSAQLVTSHCLSTQANPSQNATHTDCSHSTSRLSLYPNTLLPLNTTFTMLCNNVFWCQCFRFLFVPDSMYKYTREITEHSPRSSGKQTGHFPEANVEA